MYCWTCSRFDLSIKVCYPGWSGQYMGKYLAQAKINDKSNDKLGSQPKQLATHIKKIIKVKIT